MPNVKIELKKNETPEQAEELLFKALESQRNGEIHGGEEFSDPAMSHLLDRMELMHKEMYEEALREIIQVLEEEHNSNGDF